MPAEVVGSGRDGRITRTDVLAAAANRNRSAAAAPSVAPPAGAPARLRRRARQSPAPTTRSSSSPGPAATRPSTWCARWPRRPTRSWSPRSTTTASTRVRRAAGLSYLPFVARAVVDAIAEFPHVNAIGRRRRADRAPPRPPRRRRRRRLRGARGAGGARRRRRCGCGRSATRSPTWPTRARTKRLTADDLTGGTFTITNVGSLRHARDGADHQPAAGGHPVDRRREDAAGGRAAGRRRVDRRRPPGRQPLPVASTTGPSTAPTPPPSWPGCATSLETARLGPGGLTP